MPQVNKQKISLVGRIFSLQGEQVWGDGSRKVLKFRSFKIIFFFKPFYCIGTDEIELLRIR